MVAVGNEGGIMSLNEISLFLIGCGKFFAGIAQLIASLRRPP
jgi:hypothetical protein